MNGLKILAIDTATEACSVAVSVGGVVHRRMQIAPNGHSRLVLGMAESVLRDAGVALSQLDALAVDIGPGSFTGVRIGVGVAQGLAYGAGVKVVPVTSLAALAHGVGGDGDDGDGHGDADADGDGNGDGDGHGDGDGNADILPAIDARLSQVYYARYRRDGDALRIVTEPTLASPATAGSGDDTVTVVGVGSGWDRYAAELSAALGTSRWLADRHPDAGVVARIAARELKNAVSPTALTAFYVRDEVARKN